MIRVLIYALADDDGNDDDDDDDDKYDNDYDILLC